jgi:hypothetical protein
MERPARVRIRKRKPCTRARRRLFGWKVRLPLATAFSSLSLAHPSSHPPTTLADCVLLPVDRRWVLLLAGAVPGRRIRVAAVSPTFGRLFEGTEQPSLGQTWSPPTNPTEINAKPSSPATPLRHDIGNRPQTTLKKPIGMQQNCWQPHGKLLASGNAVSEWSGARRRNEDAGSTSGLGGLHDLSPARRSGTVAGKFTARLPTFLSTPVYKYVDSRFVVKRGCSSARDPREPGRLRR